MFDSEFRNSYRNAALALLLWVSKESDAIIPVGIPMAAYTNLGALPQQELLKGNTLAALSEQPSQVATENAVGGVITDAPALRRFRDYEQKLQKRDRSESA